MPKSVWWLAICIIVCSFLGSSNARAGDGEIVGDKLNVSVVFTYWEEDPDSWRPVFEEASRLLWNATNGQLQFGQIRVLSCGYDHEDADIWVLTGNSGAFANVLGLGDLGHIYISQTHKSIEAPALGHFGIVHEFGHYGMGLYDEYKGAEPPPMLKGVEQTFPLPHQFCVSEEDELASLMDGGSTVTPNNSRTEFCTHAHGELCTAHNEGIEVGGVPYINAQQAINGESCWETIERVLGFTPPESCETEEPPGLEAIDWHVIPGLNRVILCVDRSGSMYTRPDMIALAKEAASLLTSTLNLEKTIDVDGVPVSLPGENLGLVCFSWQGIVEFPIQELATEVERDAALTAIEEISPVPSFSLLSTDVGTALDVSFTEIISQGDVPSCSESIILVSDGEHNYGTDPALIIPDIADRGVRVHTIALGYEADIDMMMEIADATGGQSFVATSSEDLPGIVTEIVADIHSASAMDYLEGIIGGQYELLPIQIDSFAEETAFALGWNEGTLDMELTTPSGDVINLENAGDLPNVEATVDDFMIYFRVMTPEQGLWEARIDPVDVPTETHYTLQIVDSNHTISLTAMTDQEAYEPGEPVQLTVEVVAGVPVAGAEVHATLERASGEMMTLQVLDDGNENNGDMWARDGVYNVIFPGFEEGGEYVVKVVCVNVDGTGPDGDLPFVEDGEYLPAEIPPFTRYTETLYEVQDWRSAAPVAATVDITPKTLNVQTHSGNLTAYIELPELYMVDQIDVPTLRITDAVSPTSDTPEIGDFNENGVPDLMVMFNGNDVIRTVSDDVEAEIRLTGRLVTGELFVASDMVSIINIDHSTQVAVSADTLFNGAVADISWDVMEANPITYNGFLSLDGGDSWVNIFRDVEEIPEYDWTVDAPQTDEALMIVQVDSPEGVLRQSISDTFVISGEATDVEELFTTRFLGASPNPVMQMATLRYSLAKSTNVKLDVYDISGRLVRRLVSGEVAAGSYDVEWSGNDMQERRVPTGVYLYVFEAGSYRATGRMMFVR